MRTYKHQLNEHINKCLILSGLPNDQILDIIGGEGVMTDYALKAFAELIIQECAIIADSPDVDMLAVGSAIKKHFGVLHDAS